MKVKEWFYNKMMNKVCNYGDLWMNLDVERDPEAHDTVKIVDGYVNFTCRTEILKETEKAVQVRLGNAWTEWMPKSVIA